MSWSTSLLRMKPPCVVKPLHLCSPKAPRSRKRRRDSCFHNLNGYAAEWTTTPVADPSRAILFLHGGGYISGSLDSHPHINAQAGRQAQPRTLSLGYRLAPEHPFPAALDDALAGYRFLLAQGIAPQRIALGGESAGGCLAMAAMVLLRDAGDPLPACAWLSSPWTD